MVQLAGTLSVGDGATITGELQTLGGDQSIADGGAISRRTDLPTGVTNQPSPLQQGLSLAFQVLVLAPIGWALARRNPALLENVGRSLADHGLVSGTVGLLASETGVALIVFMAIAVLLLPVNLPGIVLGVVVAYAYLAFGYRRRHSVHFAATYGPSGGRLETGPGSLAEFLTERYRYYTESPDGSIRYADVDHEPWQLYAADVALERNALFRANGFARPESDPVHFYTPGVDTVATGNRTWRRD